MFRGVRRDLIRRAQMALCAVLALIVATAAASAQSAQPSTLTNMPFASIPFDGSELLYVVQRGASRKTNAATLGPQLFPNQPANTLLGNAGAVPASVAPVPVPSCSTGLTWVSGSGFGCATSFSANTAFFSTRAAFQASSSIPASWVYVTVGAVTGSYPPATGLDASALTYLRVNSSTGLFGEITVAGVIFDPIYSINPVSTGQFGDVADGVYNTSSRSSIVSLTCPGGSPTCTVSAATISSGTYNATTGLVSLTLSSAFGSGNTVRLTVSGATGTGSFASINVAGKLVQVVGTSVFYTVTTGLTMTITGGNVASVTTGFAASQFASTPNWHSQSVTLGNPILAVGTTVSSVVANTSITFNQNQPAGTYLAFGYLTTITGTCDDPFIQAAVNFALQFKYPVVQSTNGFHRLCANTIQAGWGSFAALGATLQIQLLGSGTRPVNEGAFPQGTTWLVDFSNAPGLNFQSTRNSQCSGITLLGRDLLWVEFTQVFNNAESSDPNDWIDPNLAPTGSNSGGIRTHTPFVGISEDTYSGAAPSNPYPDLTFPAFTGLSTQYNKGISSNLKVNCEADGFPVAFAVGLNTNNNGDFLNLDGFNALGGVYGVAIGNTQSRTPTFRNSSIAWFNTVLSNNIMGIATGQLGGTVSDIATGEDYQIFSISNASAEPTKFSNIYCEGCLTLGSFAGTATAPPVIIENLNIQASDTVTLAEPTSLISGSGDVTLIDPQISGSLRLLPLTSGSGRIVIYGGNNDSTESGAPSTAVQTFTNFVGGMFPGDAAYNSQGVRRFDVPQPYQGTFWYNSGSAAPCPPASNCVFGAKYYGNVLNFSSPSFGLLNRVPIDPAARTYCDEQNYCYSMARPNAAQIQLANTAFAGVSPTLVGDVLSFGYCAIFQGGTTGANNTLAVGDGLYHANTHTLFVVTSVGSITGNGNCTNVYPITAQQQNNILITSTNAWAGNNGADATMAGLTYVIKASLMAPLVLAYGTVASNCAFSAVNFGDGFTGGTLSTYYASGDAYEGPLPYGNPTAPWYVPKAGMTLGAVTNGSPGSIAAGTGTCASSAYAAGLIATLGAITGGSGGTPGTYAPVALTGGTGTGATASVTVSGGGAVSAVQIINPGVNYVAADTLSAAGGNIGGVSGFSVPVSVAYIQNPSKVRIFPVPLH